MLQTSFAMKPDTKDKKSKPLKLSRRRTREDVIAAKELARAATEEPKSDSTFPQQESRPLIEEDSKPKPIPLPAATEEPKVEPPPPTPPSTPTPAPKRKSYGPALGAPPAQRARPATGFSGETSPSQLDSFDPNDPFGDILPKAETPGTQPTENKKFALKPNKPNPRTKPPMPIASTAAAPPPRTSKPPLLPSKPAPHIDNGSSALLDASLENLQYQSPPEKRKSILPSVFIAIIVLVLMGGAGFGVWFLLSEPPEEGGTASKLRLPFSLNNNSAKNNDSELSSAQSTAEIFADLSNAAVLRLINSEDINFVQSGTNIQIIEQSIPASLLPTDNLVKPVTSFLESAHVGASRGLGDDARVMLNKESFLVGDIVEDSTRLSFIGAIERRLVFRDKNGTVYIKSF